MTFNKRLAVTISFMIAACACYLLGYEPGFRVFFLIGAVLETVFWVRLFNRRHKSNQRLKQLKRTGAET